MSMKFNHIILGLILIVVFATVGLSQNSGSRWIKTNKPGSASFDDASIDKEALAFLDSLMQRDDIVVTFLGAADNLKWKNLPNDSKVSRAFDQAKKLERALSLQSRYGRGQVGITDEPVRGVKVVWEPKPPDVFKMREDVDRLEAMNDSLLRMMADLKKNQRHLFASLQDSITHLLNSRLDVKEHTVNDDYFDWEVKTGVLAWTGRSNYDLMVPSLGIALKRQYWAFEIEGGFTPWSRQDVTGERGDAMLMGTVSLLPRNLIEYKLGVFSGWEFLSKTDNWTMKVLGVSVGPSITWKYFEVFAGYAFSKISTLTEDDQWNNGALFLLNFKFLIH